MHTLILGPFANWFPLKNIIFNQIGLITGNLLVKPRNTHVACTPFWNMCHPKKLLCHSEKKYKCVGLFLKHISGWHCVNFVISRANNGIITEKQTNLCRTWPYFWSLSTFFKCFRTIALTCAGLRYDNACTVPIWNMFEICTFKGCRMGRSDKVSLWYITLLINTRFRFLF